MAKERNIHPLEYCYRSKKGTSICPKCGSVREYRASADGAWVCMKCPIIKYNRHLAYEARMYYHKAFKKFLKDRPACAECKNHGNTKTCRTCVYSIPMDHLDANFVPKKRTKDTWDTDFSFRNL